MSKILNFPTDINTDMNAAVCFRVKDEGDSIYLPMPAGIAFSDGGNYSTINLGMLDSGMSADKIGETLKNNLNMDSLNRAVAAGMNVVNNGTEVLKKGADILVNSIANKVLGEGPGIKEYGLFASKKFVNPNTNTTFAGNKLRSFSFSFKMISRSVSDTDNIRKIHSLLRTYIYPKTTVDAVNILLDYPPLWEIKFYDAGSFSESNWYPKIYESYLTDLNTTFNAGGAMHRTDGSPLEVDVSITFQESRTLNRKEIEEMNPK